MATVVYGSELATLMKDELKSEMKQLKVSGKRIPKLTVVIVGENPSSISYIRSKEKLCDEVGLLHGLVSLPEDVCEEELIDVIDSLNQDNSVDGILVQLPLPKHIRESIVIERIDPSKDVDGFHPVNVGHLMLQEKSFHPCTAKSVMTILKSIGFDDLSGKHAVVIGRSNIVGKPVAQLLMAKNATVTVCHSRTNDIRSITKLADILVVAVGKARLVDASYVKEGAVVIDVGVNRDEFNKLCGDVDFASVEPVASYITPVPKGVGPMTSVMLLMNTLEAYKEREMV